MIQHKFIILKPQQKQTKEENAQRTTTVLIHTPFIHNFGFMYSAKDLSNKLKVSERYIYKLVKKLNLNTPQFREKKFNRVYYNKKALAILTTHQNNVENARIEAQKIESFNSEQKQQNATQNTNNSLDNLLRLGEGGATPSNTVYDQSKMKELENAIELLNHKITDAYKTIADLKEDKKYLQITNTQLIEANKSISGALEKAQALNYLDKGKKD